MKTECPNVEKPTPSILPAKHKSRSYQTILNEVKEETGIALGTTSARINILVTVSSVTNAKSQGISLQTSQ